jgi:Fe-S cluster assembly protein SufD
MPDLTNPIVASPHSHGQLTHPGDARPERFASYALADFPVPTGREEEWRFTPLARLRGLHNGTMHTNGAGRTILVEVDPAPEVQVETVGRDDPRIGRTGPPVDRVAALAHASFSEATVVTVPQDAVASRPTVVTLSGRGAAMATFGHLVVELKPFAEAIVVLDHRGSATYAGNVELLVGEGARLTLVSLQDWADDTVHMGHQVARVGRDATLKSVVVTFGGELVRLFLRVSYDGTGGDLELLGLCFADAGQHLEHRMVVEHTLPHCRSNVAYKGALQGTDAHTVWIGDVVIRPTAQGTETYELNRNLVLTDGARADSVPNLEIETGEVVKAGHASTTGRFDDEQLFYLQSRGIPADEARRLVVRGFFAEVIQQMGVPELRERLIGAVDAELERTVE